MSNSHTANPAGDPCEVYRRYNDAQNDGDLDQIEHLLDSQLSVRVNGHASLSSVDDDRRALRRLYATYPDYRRQLVDCFASGDRVVAQWRMLGSPAEADATALDVAGCSVAVVRDGRILSADLYYDGAALDAVMRPETRQT